MKRIGPVAVLVLCAASLLSRPLFAQQQAPPPPSQPEYQGPNSPPPAPTPPNRPEYQAPDSAPPPPPSDDAYSRRWIPDGTNISIRTNENINANEAGSTYSAEIAQDVVDPNGQVLIPRGTPARLAVVSTGESAAGGHDLALALQSIRINGHTYMVETNTTNGGAGGTGVGKNKRTAEYVGGGALLGTVIGAIAGGGKGAAIGAIAGGGAGAGAQVLTKGRQINLPAESMLTFRLEQPIRLR